MFLEVIPGKMTIQEASMEVRDLLNLQRYEVFIRDGPIVIKANHLYLLIEVITEIGSNRSGFPLYYQWGDSCGNIKNSIVG